MRSLAWALLLGAALAGTSGRGTERLINVSTGDELVAALRTSLENVTIILAPGRYVVPPTWKQRRTGCGGPAVTRPVSIGLTVSGRNIQLVGSVEQETVIASDSDVRINFEKCFDCKLERVTVTNATPPPAFEPRDGPIRNGTSVGVRDSRVQITNCVLNGNGSPSLAQGGGVLGEKGADIIIDSNQISRNVWGIVLMEDARAVIKNNLMEGVGSFDELVQGDKGTLLMSGGGAIDVECEADATVERNHLRGLAVGIRVAGATSVSVRNNIIEQVYGDGVSATRSGLGRVRIEENVIYQCGRAAIDVNADGDQQATRNIVVETGLANPPASAILATGSRSDVAVKKNTLYANTVSDKALDRDVSREAFWRARRPWTRTYRNTAVGVDGRHKFYESAFLTRYGRWAD